MVGGVKYEHGHRMFAEFVGLLIIVMAVWTQRVERRKWMKALGWIALGAVIGQGVLGGLTVLFGLPWYISTAHATLAQTIFCVVTAMALFTSKSWLQEAEPIAERGTVSEHSSAHGLAAACVWMQLILGAAFRHTGIRLLPHIIGACVVAAMLCWTVVRVLTRYNGVAATAASGAVDTGDANGATWTGIRRLHQPPHLDAERSGASHIRRD